MIGRDPDQLQINPTGVRLFGRRARYGTLLGGKLTPARGSHCWRLLRDDGGQVLVFLSLPVGGGGGQSIVGAVFP